MFTGIIQTIGTIQAAQRRGPDMTMIVEPGGLDHDAIQVGDSVSVNGVCLTVVSLADARLAFDLSAETISRSTFAHLQKGVNVNLELALLPTTRLGGHIVTGHVDGLGELIAHQRVGGSVEMGFRVPVDLSPFIAAKGSICIDGVSLTVNHVAGDVFDVNIVPHTLQQTTLGAFVIGQQVHIEVDLIARYVARLMSVGGAHNTGALKKALLAERGFLRVEDQE